MPISNRRLASLAGEGGARPRSLLALLLAAFTVLSLVSSPSAVLAQEGDEPAEREQTGLEEFSEPIVNDDPPFAFHIPEKRKFKKLREKWRVVNIPVRKTADLDPLRKAIDEEKAKEQPNAERLAGLEGELRRLTQVYDNYKFLLEVDGDRNEFVRIQIEALNTNSPKIEMINPRPGLEKNWKQVEVLVDQETTTKAERKKGGLSHSLILLGKPENEERGLWRVESRVMKSKDQVKVYRVLYIHRMDASTFNKDKKGALKEMELLFRLVQWP